MPLITEEKINLCQQYFNLENGIEEGFVYIIVVLLILVRQRAT